MPFLQFTLIYSKKFSIPCFNLFLGFAHVMLIRFSRNVRNDQRAPSRTHHTMLSNGISRAHSLFRPHISHTFNSYGLRCFALKAVSSSTPASEIILETASLNAISASKKTTSRKKKLDSLKTASSSAISTSKGKATSKKKKLDSLETVSLNAIPEVRKATSKKKKLDPLETVSLNPIPPSKKATSKKKKLDSVNTILTSNSSVPGVQIDQFPVYSYKHCNPLPTVVYTQHEEEANELIARLKAGYVFQ